MWYVYLLYNRRINRTYVGSTKDPHRRLKQHNGEIKGGAKATERGQPDWRLNRILSGFADQSEAMRWEKIIKLRGMGIKERAALFDMVGDGICPPGKHYDVPEGIKVEKV